MSQGSSEKNAPNGIPGVQRARARRRPPILAIVGAVAVIVVAIVGYLVHEAHRIVHTDATSGNDYLVDEATCYAAHPPDQHYRMERTDLPLVDDMTTDHDGFRIGAGWEHPAAPRCRILAVGDSFTEGLWVRGDDAFPARLERILNDRGYSVRVDNGGLRGVTIHQERIAALWHWAPLHHDIVLVASSGNDLTDLINLEDLHCRLDGPFPVALKRTRQSLRMGAVTAMLSHTLMAAMGGLQTPVNAVRCEEAGRRYQRTLFDMNAALHARGQRLVFAPLEPLWCGDDKTFSGTGYTDKLLAAARQAGIAVADMRNTLAPDLTLAPVDSHPSAKGHERLAEVLANKLVAEHVLDRCR